MVSIGAGAPPPWWPRKPDGTAERVYTTDGVDWDLTPPKNATGTVTRGQISFIWREWQSFYAPDPGTPARRWNLIAEPWVPPSGKSSHK